MHGVIATCTWARHWIGYGKCYMHGVGTAYSDSCMFNKVSAVLLTPNN